MKILSKNFLTFVAKNAKKLYIKYSNKIGSITTYEVGKGYRW